MAINLLPTDLAPTSPVNKIAGTLRKIAIWGFVVFILGLLSVGGYMFYLNLQIQNSEETQQELRGAIGSLEQTEQRYVILKDRLKKAEQVLGADSAAESVDNFESIVASFPADVTLTESNIAPDITELTFLSRSSSSLTQVFSRLFASENYKRIKLSSFGFTPTAGYLVTLELTN